MTAVAPNDGAGRGIELTKKGEAYCVRHEREAVEAEIERLIGLLDALDGDPDFEPTLGAPEPKIGGYVPPTRGTPGDQTHWAQGLSDDGEREPIEDDEPSLGGSALYVGDGRFEVDLELDDSDREPNGDEGDYSCEDDYPVPSSMTSAQRQAVSHEATALLHKASVGRGEGR